MNEYDATPTPDLRAAVLAPLAELIRACDVATLSMQRLATVLGVSPEVTG